MIGVAEMRTADDFFAAAAELGRAIAEQRRAHRAAVRDIRNARRRENYARQSKALRLPAVVEVEDWEAPDACYCNATSNPPCGWCENATEEDFAA